MQDASESHEPMPAVLSVDDVDTEFLPLIYDIIRSVERDPHDSQKNKDSQDTTQKVLELQKKLDLAREQIQKLPGVEHSPEEQLQQLESLRNQLKLKRELLLKYRIGKMIRGIIHIVVQYMANHLPHVENKLADSKLMRTIARSLVRFGLNVKYFAEKDSKLLKDAPNKLKTSARRFSSEFTQTVRESKNFFKK